jgi:hypothetical protein
MRIIGDKQLLPAIYEVLPDWVNMLYTCTALLTIKPLPASNIGQARPTRLKLLLFLHNFLQECPANVLLYSCCK